MVTERYVLEQLRSRLLALGYPDSSLRAQVLTVLGKRIDLVAYESGKPKVVFELKAGARLPSVEKTEDLRFHPAVRQAQSLAQELGAPYFAVTDSNTILWFDIDIEQGRPRLLPTPVLPLIQDLGDQETAEDRKLALRVVFALSDIARGRTPSQENVGHVGLAILARLFSEEGDKELERLLLSDLSPQLFDQGLPRFDITTSADFYHEVFSTLHDVELSRIQPGDFVDALDEFLHFSIDRDRFGNFKLPKWISYLMVSLAQIDLQAEVLDLYSNFGDGVAAIARTYPRTVIYSLAPNAISYLWDKLKRVVLRLERRNVARIYSTQEYIVQAQQYAEQVDYVLVSPPFGSRRRLENGSSLRSEDLFLELALTRAKPGGRVVAILPENLLFSPSRRPTRHSISEAAWIRSIISLQQFLPGTSIKANIVVLEKKSSYRRMGRVMMCSLQETDVHEFSVLSKSIHHNRRIQEILNAHQAHLRGESVPDEKWVWFVSPEEFDSRSWAVSYYDPARRLEVGSEYPTVQLKELAHLQKGSPLTLDKNGTLPVIGPAAVRTLSIDPAKLDRTTRERLSVNPVIAKRDDILVHAVGQYRGNAAVVGPGLENCFVSRNIIALSPISQQTLPEYLAIALNSRFVKNQLEERATGSVIRQLTIRRLQDLLIPVPDLATQRLVIEKVAAAHRRLLEREEEVRRAESALKVQYDMLQEILDSVHWGGDEDA